MHNFVLKPRRVAMALAAACLIAVGSLGAAAALMGQERPFTATPWFWSDQYDKKLQMAGLSMGADSWAVRGDMAGDINVASFSVFHYRQGRLIAADSVNAGKDHLAVRKLLDAQVSPTPAQLADSSCELAALIKK